MLAAATGAPPSAPPPPAAAAPGGADVADGVEGGDAEEEEDPDTAMAAMLGFSSFDSSKGKMVADNQTGPSKGGAKQVLQRKYRQYMNRVGGFNRALDSIK